MPAVPQNAQTSLNASQLEVTGQLTTASALEAKLMGLLGLMAAAAGVMLTVAHGLASNRWILLVGALGAVILGLSSLVGSEDLKSGPDPIAFYKEYGGVSAEEFVEQLLADLGGTITLNRERLEFRRALLAGAFSWAVLWGLAFGIVRLFQ